MKTMRFFILGLFLFDGVTTFAQCGVKIDRDTSFVCGSSVQLSANPEWVKLNSSINYPLNSVFFVDADTGYAVGGIGGLEVGGIILKTVNGGASWVQQTSGTYNTLYSVYFTNADTGYVSGDQGTILKTTDGGLNWTTYSMGTWINPLYSIYFTDADTGYAVGDFGIIFKTTDGGANWVKITSGYGTSINLRSVHFLDADNGYAVGIYPNLGTITGTILKTTDGGINWSTQYTSLPLNSVYFTDINTGYAVSGGTIYFTDANTGYVVGTNVTVLKTTDGGIHWSTQNFTGGETILKTINGGGNWTSQSSGTAEILNSVYFTDNTGYIVGSNGTILKFSELISYSWYPSNGLNVTNVSNPIANPTDITTYIVTATTANGCIAKDTVNVVIEPLTVNTGMDTSIICGGSIQFDDPITNYTGSGTLTYAWLPSAGLNDANIARPTAEITSDKTYTLSVSTPNGCITKDSVKVTVNPFIATINDLSVSCGNNTQLSLTTNYTGSGNLNYNWNPSTGLSAADISNPFVTLITPAVYSVEVQTPNGCTANDNVNVGTSVVDFNPSICMVTVNDSDKNVVVWQREQNTAIDSFYIYRESSVQTGQYDLIGKLPYTSTGVFTDVTSNARVQSNKYKIAVKDVCGFATDNSPEHKTMHLTINKGIGNIWNLIWEQYIGVPVSSYGIYRGTTKSDLAKIGSLSGSNTTFTDETAPEEDVYYQIEVVLPQACTNLKSTGYASSRSNIISSADVAEGISVNSGTQAFIYPNPATDKLNIKNVHSSNAIIIIIDLQGKQILNKKISSDQIDISNLPKGYYTVKLIDSGNVLVNKFVKE